jgi:hypothetical protein
MAAAQRRPTGGEGKARQSRAVTSDGLTRLQAACLAGRALADWDPIEVVLRWEPSVRCS